jgi:hypothetical protein
MVGYGQKEISPFRAGSTFRTGTRTIDTLVLHLDSLPILPASFVLKGLDSSDYHLNSVTATLHITGDSVLGKTISFSYRVFPFNFTRHYQHRSTQILLPKAEGYHSSFQVIQTLPAWVNADESQLEIAGSIARGFSMGNNQDPVLSSNMNLQLSGTLADGLTVSAHITDRNIPMQPEGNSRMIQDFDRIFIHLNYKNQLLLHAGDIDIVSPSSYFMVVNKRVLGMSLSSIQKIKNVNTLQNQVGGGINKGIFARQTLSVANGVQGPYRLTGTYQEATVIIVSGSERVYIDGQLLTRGEENDYVMNYNTGEITFTPRTLITAEKRVVVEFEYKNEHFNRFSLFTYNQFLHEKNDRLKINVHFLHEQDDRNRSIQPELDNPRKQFLSSLGDQLTGAYYPVVDTATFNSNEVLYVAIDTVVNGETYHIYRHSTRADVQLYRPGFTLTGEGQGNYVLDRSTANGRVFRWVAPVNGIKQGNYDPVLLLTAPQMTDLGVVAAEYRFKKHSLLQIEGAFSNHDLNTFSQKDKNDNLGYALKMGFNTRYALKSKKQVSSPWTLAHQLQYEWLHRDFYTTESFRNVEFARDYNLNSLTERKNAEQMLHFQTGISHEKTGSIDYLLNFFHREDEITATRNELTTHLHGHGVNCESQTSFLLSSDSSRNSQFLKNNLLLSQSIKSMEIGINHIGEYNLFKNSIEKQIRPESYAFNEARFFVQNNDSSRYRFHVSYMNRIDYYALDSIALRLQTMHHEGKMWFEWNRWTRHRLRGNVTYRNMHTKDSLGKGHDEHFFIGNAEYSGRFFKNAILVNTYYEVGSGQEQKKSFSYLKVAAGQGTHAWNDYNANGIEELEEFEPAKFQDEASYVKIWLTTTEYIMTCNNKLTQSLSLRPANVWAGKKGLKGFVARLSNTTTLQSEQKSQMYNRFALLNPFPSNKEDTSIVSSNLNFTNTLSFNQLSKYWGMDFMTRTGRVKSLLYYGFEQQNQTLNEILLRLTPHPTLSLKTIYTNLNRRNISDYMQSKNYTIERHAIEERLQLDWKNIFFLTASYIFSRKENLQGMERAFQHQVFMEGNSRMIKRGNLNLSLQFIYIQYNEEINTAICYEMLDGLLPGHNALWALGYQANITDYLQIELAYNGRYSRGNKVIHTGNLQVRAKF